MAEEEKQRQEQEEKANSVPPKPTTTVGPNATILKPRSAAQPKVGGLVLKTPSEKPSLVSKPAAPTPARSPWASLPPVDKVPPIAINPDVPSSATRTQGYDAYPNASSPQLAQPLVPAMEIAADSFSRNRGDAPNGHPGQLYNAQSGRYEPANTGRRGSVRKDQNFRPPSLLQRGPTNDARGTAGSSEAALPRPSQQDQAPWMRRRSSNVSGDGSARRDSVVNGMPNGAHDERRGSQQSQALQSPTTPGQGMIPHDGSPALPQAVLHSPVVRHAQMADPRSDSGSPKPTAVDIIAQQKQTMKEKRELAIKRKQEEEAREEAAKKERIRLRMEAMGLPPLEDKKEPPKREIQKSIEKRPAEPSQPDGQEAEKISKNEDPIQLPPKPQDEAAAVTKSPPKPPQPNASGAPQQYGMMKVHGSVSTTVQQPDNERMHVDKLPPQAPGPKASPPGLQPRPAQGERRSSPLVNGLQQPEQGIEKAQETSKQHQIREQPRQQPWNQIPNDQKALAGSSWSSQAAGREPSNTHNNVWGAPNPRGLGNGAFDRSIQRPQSRQQDQFASPTLAPIGPPKHLQTSREPREHSKGGDDVKNMEDFQTMPPFPPTEPRTQARGPDPLGHHLTAEQQTLTPPQYLNGLQSRPPTNQVEPLARPQDQQKSSLAAWGNFHATSAQEEAIKKHQLAAKFAEEARQGIRNETAQLPVMKETWKQVKVDQHSTQRSIVGIERGQITHEQATGSSMTTDFQSPTFGSPLNMVPSAPAGIGRGSRFFPTGRIASMPIHVHPAPFMPGHRRGSSPPPPDSEGHPAFLRDHPIPRVSLPLIGPKPKVKLPPSVASPAQSPRMAEAQPVNLRSASQPLVNNPSWQDRFNGLLGVKKVSPERTFAPPVEPVVTSVSSASNKLTSAFALSKQPLSSLTIDAPAVSVSLPQPGLSSIILGFKADSKDVADEEELFIPESGSLPVARLPFKSIETPRGAIKPSKRGSQKPTRPSKEVEAVSKEDLLFAAMIVNGRPLIFINLDGMSQVKSKPLTSSPGGQSSVPREDTRFEQQEQRPRNFSGSTKPQGKAFKARQNTGNGGLNNPKSAPTPQHSKNIRHQNGSQVPNRVSSTVGAVGGWDSSHAR